MQDRAQQPSTAFEGLGYQGVEAQNPGMRSAAELCCATGIAGLQTTWPSAFAGGGCVN